MMSGKTIVTTLLILVMLIGGALAIYVSQFNTLPDSSYTLFDEIASPTSTDRILVVTPHQDDETIGAGAYIYRATKVGAQVEVILATDGNKHGLKDIRNQEEINASATLGVAVKNIIFYDYPDGGLESNQQVFEQRLEKDIATFHPTVVITTLPEDIHSDHAAAGAAVKAAYGQSGKSFTPEFFLVHYHRYPRPIGYYPSAHLLPPLDLVNVTYEWKVMTLTDNEITQKQQAISSYKTQLSPKNPVLTQLIHSFERQNELFATYR